jgi:hypothetical protein
MNRPIKARVGLIAITVVVLSIFAYGTCFLLKVLYWDWMKIPIGLGGGLFFLVAVPAVFVLSLPYSIVMVILVDKRIQRSKLEALLICFSVGAVTILIVLAIIFPCEVEPYFVGGYLLRMFLKS